MSDAGFYDGRYNVAEGRQKAENVRLPTPQPFAAPVFIHDCVIPAGGETLLSLLMKRMIRDAEAETAPDQSE